MKLRESKTLRWKRINQITQECLLEVAHLEIIIKVRWILTVLMVFVADQTWTVLKCQLREPSVGRRCQWWIKYPKVRGFLILEERNKVVNSIFVWVIMHSYRNKMVSLIVQLITVTKKVITSEEVVFLTLVILLQGTWIKKLITRPSMILNKESVWEGPTVNTAQMFLTGQTQ